MTSTLDQPELDYAFLAEFARVEANRLTAVGASFTQVQVSTLPIRHRLYVAGRIRAPKNAPAFELEISISGPGDSPQLSLSNMIDPNIAGHPYDGKMGLTFAAGVDLTLETEGLYEVQLAIEGKPVRRLIFAAISAQG